MTEQNQPIINSAKKPQIVIGLFITGTVAWVSLGFGVLSQSENMLAILLASTISYFLAMYLYFALIEQVSSNLKWPAGLASLIALLLGLAFVSSEMAAHLTFEIARLFVAGAVTGWLLYKKRGLLTAYLVGCGCLGLLSIIEYYPSWIMWIAGIEEFTDEMVTMMESNIAFAGATEEMRFQMVQNLRASVGTVARLAPALMIMSAVTQLTIGFIVYLYASARSGAILFANLRFTSVKIPYQVAAGVIIASAVRLLSSGTWQLAADNLIFILAIYYSIAGLALTDWMLKRLKLARWFRIMFYFFMFLTGALGFIIVAIVGFIDSFKDWRQTPIADLNLKND